MKELVGILICILGIVLGVYLGIWVMLIGGITQFITALSVLPNSALDLACGIVKVLFSGVVGWLSFFVLLGIGKAIMD